MKDVAYIAIGTISSFLIALILVVAAGLDPSRIFGFGVIASVPGAAISVYLLERRHEHR